MLLVCDVYNNVIFGCGCMICMLFVVVVLVGSVGVVLVCVLVGSVWLNRFVSMLLS